METSHGDHISHSEKTAFHHRVLRSSRFLNYVTSALVIPSNSIPLKSPKTRTFACGLAWDQWSHTRRCNGLGSLSPDEHADSQWRSRTCIKNHMIQNTMKSKGQNIIVLFWPPCKNVIYKMKYDTTIEKTSDLKPQTLQWCHSKDNQNWVVSQWAGLNNSWYHCFKRKHIILINVYFDTNSITKS